MHKLTQTELIEHVSLLIAGLHVPRSMHVLGKAEYHYDFLRDAIGDVGWSQADVIEQKLREALANAEKVDA